MDESVSRTRNPRGQGARLREELIEAASDLLAELGSADRLSIRAVAAATGVAAPSVYRHFPDLDNLLLAVVVARAGEFAQALDDAAAVAEDPFEALRRRCRAYLSFATSHPAHYRVLFNATGLGPLNVGTEGRYEHPCSASFTGLKEAVRRCLDTLSRSTADRKNHFLAFQLWAWLHGLVNLRISKSGMPWPPVEALLDATLADLGLAGGPPDPK